MCGVLSDEAGGLWPEIGRKAGGDGLQPGGFGSPGVDGPLRQQSGSQYINEGSGSGLAGGVRRRRG